MTGRRALDCGLEIKAADCSRRGGAIIVYEKERDMTGWRAAENRWGRRVPLDAERECARRKEIVRRRIKAWAEMRESLIAKGAWP